MLSIEKLPSFANGSKDDTDEKSSGSFRLICISLEFQSPKEANSDVFAALSSACSSWVKSAKFIASKSTWS